MDPKSSDKPTVVQPEVSPPGGTLDDGSADKGCVPDRSGKGHASAETWRDLAKRIQQETNPDVMMQLTQELIAELDAEQLRKKRPPAK